MEEKLRELINKFLQEYSGHHTMKNASPRPFADDEDEIESYTYKSIYGGDGGHYKNEPAFHNPNRTKMGMFELKKFIEDTIKEQAYNHATLTTQGLPNSSRAIVPTDEYPFSARPKSRLPGIMEEDESTSFKVVNVDTGKTIDFGLDKAKALEIAAFAIEDNINAEVLKMKDVNDVGNLKDEPIDPDYQGPSYDEVYLKGKLVGIEDASKYDKDEGQLIIYPDMGEMRWKTRSSQYIKFGLVEGELQFFSAFGMRASYDELKRAFPGLPPMGESSYSGFMNVMADHVYGTGMAVDLDTAKAMVQAMNKGLDAERKSQSAFYTREPGSGGTGIDERMNEQSGESKRKRESGQKLIAQAALIDLIDARDEAVAAANQGKGEAVKAISQQEIQLAETNKKIEVLKQEWTRNNVRYKQLEKIFLEMPVDTDEALKAKTEVYEQIVELREKIQGLGEEIKTTRKSRNEMTKGIQQANSANSSQPSVTKQFNPQIRDARKAITQVGKGGEEIAEILLRQYEKERANVNLMEQMDSYNETTRGSLQKFFEMFEAGKTTSEVIRHYAKNGIQIPEQFISKVKKQFESYKKLKLELGFSEQEAKDFTKALDLSQKEKPKKLSTKIFKK